MALKDHQRFRLPATRQPYVLYDRPLGFENKFSTPFGFETGARIEPPVKELRALREHKHHCSTPNTYDILQVFGEARFS